MYRVYIEDFNEPIWAVDGGDSSTAIRVKRVFIEAFATTEYNLLADNVTEPKAWLRVSADKLTIVNNTAILR